VNGSNSVTSSSIIQGQHYNQKVKADEVQIGIGEVTMFFNLVRQRLFSSLVVSRNNNDSISVVAGSNPNGLDTVATSATAETASPTAPPDQAATTRAHGVFESDIMAELLMPQIDCVDEILARVAGAGEKLNITTVTNEEEKEMTSSKETSSTSSNSKEGNNTSIITQSEQVIATAPVQETTEISKTTLPKEVEEKVESDPRRDREVLEMLFAEAQDLLESEYCAAALLEAGEYGLRDILLKSICLYIGQNGTEIVVEEDLNGEDAPGGDADDKSDDDKSEKKKTTEVTDANSDFEKKNQTDVEKDDANKSQTENGNAGGDEKDDEKDDDSPEDEEEKAKSKKKRTRKVIVLTKMVPFLLKQFETVFNPDENVFLESFSNLPGVRTYCKAVAGIVE